MKLNLLINVKLLSKFYENAVEGIEIVTIISSCCCKMKDDQVIIFLYSFQRLVVLKPFYEECFFAYTSICLND